MQYQKLDKIIDAYKETLKRPGLVNIVKEIYYCMNDDVSATIAYLRYRKWSPGEINEAIRLLSRYQNNRIKYPELIMINSN